MGIIRVMAVMSAEEMPLAIVRRALKDRRRFDILADALPADFGQRIWRGTHEAYILDSAYMSVNIGVVRA